MNISQESLIILKLQLKDDKSIYQINKFGNNLYKIPLDNGLYLYTYNQEDVYIYEIIIQFNKILSYFDGWLFSLITINRKYDDFLKQIYLRVGYTKQFNLERNISDTSTIMIIFIRDKNPITINELNMKSSTNYSYYFDNNNTRIKNGKSYEKLDSSPEIFVYIYLYCLYYLYRRIGIIMVK